MSPIQIVDDIIRSIKLEIMTRYPAIQEKHFGLIRDGNYFELGIKRGESIALVSDLFTENEVANALLELTKQVLAARKVTPNLEKVYVKDDQDGNGERRLRCLIVCSPSTIKYPDQEGNIYDVELLSGDKGEGFLLTTAKGKEIIFPDEIKLKKFLHPDNHPKAA